MESIGQALKQIPGLQGYSARCSNIDPKRKAEIMCQAMNDTPGDMNQVDGYECQECSNKGVLFYLVEEPGLNGETVYREMSKTCRCMKIRNSIRRMKKSGLESTISKCTFDRYETPEEWQKVLKQRAIDFAQNADQMENKWFFVGGAVGCGKTHICTAIVREMLHKGKEARYMLWIDESTKLKGCVNDAEKHSALIEPLKHAEVLYIDDFLKITRGQGGDEIPPSAADIKLAYEILNYRYQQPNLITIISSERHVAEIEAIDSAVGSRIYEKTKENACNIARKPERNYRTRDMDLL